MSHFNVKGFKTFFSQSKVKYFFSQEIIITSLSIEFLQRMQYYFMTRTRYRDKLIKQKKLFNTTYKRVS